MREGGDKEKHIEKVLELIIQDQRYKSDEIVLGILHKIVLIIDRLALAGQGDFSRTVLNMLQHPFLQHCQASTLALIIGRMVGLLWILLIGFFGGGPGWKHILQLFLRGI